MSASRDRCGHQDEYTNGLGMELARSLLKLWQRRTIVAVGLVVAIGAAAVSMSLLRSPVYSSASTQMIVDAPRSALGDPNEDLTPFTSRAVVFARLMTTPEVLNYIGRKAGIPGNLIAASGPTELDAPQATHVPTVSQGDQTLKSAAVYKLNFLQNPALPTVDIYSEAPTTKQAISLANGAVSGFAAYMHSLDAQGKVPDAQRVTIRQAGAATGGVVDPGAKKSIAAIIFALVFGAWCAGVLFFSNLREQLRVAAHTALPLRPGNRALEHPPVPRLRRASDPAPESSAEAAEAEFEEPALTSTSPSNAAGGSGEVVRSAWLRKSS